MLMKLLCTGFVVVVVVVVVAVVVVVVVVIVVVVVVCVCVCVCVCVKQNLLSNKKCSISLSSCLCWDYKFTSSTGVIF